ncbi:MAG: response regulator, partial [Myxococcota bacterium]|nr:response regulator [Myxococcota bacterium]
LLRTAENRALEAAADSALDTITTEIEQGIDRQLYGVIILAWKWDWDDGAARERWTADARTLIAEAPLLYGIAWLAEDFSVLAREWRDSAESWIFGNEERLRIFDALRLAREKRRIIGVVSKGQAGEKILMIHVGRYRQGEPKGFVIGAYALDSLLSNIFVTEPDGFHVEISDASGPIWASVGEVPPSGSSRTGTSSTMNMSWNIEVSPGKAVVSTYLTWLPEAIGLGGAFVGLLTGLALFMGVDSRRKARWLELGNARLREEMLLRDRAERSRIDTEDEMIRILNSLPVHVWSAKVTREGNFEMRRMSTVMAQISGRPVDFFDGTPETWLKTTHPDDQERLKRIVLDVTSGKTPGLDYEYRIVRPDGTIRHMSDSIRVTKIDEGLRLDGMARDVTQLVEAEKEHAQLEARFQQAQKMDSLGVLAGGVAHDFNNLLVAMLGHARLAEDDLPEDSPIRSNLQSVIKAARRAGELCEQMLTYAGKVPIVTEPIELESIVEEMGELLRASIPASTFIRYGFDKEVPCLQGDPSQIRQVALNLITNASEAIGSEGGEISLMVQVQDCGVEDLSSMDFGEELRPGAYAVLIVSDTGLGMDEATQEKIFEPFYSTKFAGRGLGLAAVVGIVRGHGGAIRIESEPGQGTSIAVFFPAATEPEAPRRAVESRHTNVSWRGKGKVLLAEDEEAARDFAHICLERAGAQVVDATDGLEAVALFQAQPDEFSCVLLDLTMPNLDGVETYSRLKAIRPDVPVILCSGYPKKAATERFSEMGLAGFLKKPYEPEELLACLDRIEEPETGI